MNERPQYESCAAAPTDEAKVRSGPKALWVA